MCASPDGTKLASTSKGGILTIFDCHTGQLLGGFQVSPRPLATVGENELRNVIPVSSKRIMMRKPCVSVIHSKVNIIVSGKA